MGLQISPTPIELYVSPSETLVVHAYGDTVYYGHDKTVSASEHAGVLESGDIMTMTKGLWFATAPVLANGDPGSARLEVQSIPPIVAGSTGKNTALKSLVAALAKLGLITDRTT